MSFIQTFEAEFKKLWHEAPKWNTVAYNTLTALAPEIILITTLTAGPAAGAAAVPIIAAVKGDLTLATAIIQSTDKATAAQKLPAVLGSLRDNLTSLLAAIKVSNPNSVAEADVLVQAAVASVDSVAAIIPKTASTPAAPVAPAATTPAA